jgi:hypothetical protein
MRLDPLCDAQWRYELMRWIDPSPGRDGRVYGQGRGTLTGRLAGEAQWSNYPRLHGDHALPDARGVIELPTGDEVLFALGGLSSLSDGRGVHVMTFQTESSEYGWLNDVLAVGEGSIDPDRGLLAMRYYECVVDHLPRIEEMPDP